MLQRFLTYLKEGDRFAGLEISTRNGQAFYGLLEVKREKNILQIQNWAEEETLEGILQNVPKNIPLNVLIQTDQVISKMIHVSGKDHNSLLLEAFPNLEINSFYYEIIMDSNSSIISIAGKRYIDELLTTIIKDKYSLVQFHLGLSTLEVLLPYWESNKIITTNLELNIEDQKIAGFNPNRTLNTQKYLINNLELMSTQILAFSGILAYLQNHLPISNFIDINQHSVRKFRYGRSTALSMKGLLIFLLMILLCNFFIFNYYYDRIGALNDSLAMTANQQSSYEQLEFSVNRKKNKIELMNSSSWSKTSLYLDRFASNLPSSIKLDQLTFQPLQMPVREGKSIAYREGIITLSGSSSNSGAFSQWIEKLEQRKWIKSVETTDYGVQKGNTSIFILEIILDETGS